MIETINKIVRTQRQIMSEFEANSEELAKKLAMPLESKKSIKIAKEPVSLETQLEMKKIAALEI